MSLTAPRFFSFAGALAAICLFVATSNATSIITKWTFETSIPANAGPYAAEVGTGTGSSSGLGTISSPAGNGSAHSLSANGWTTSSFYLFNTATTGASNLFLAFYATGSSTGPRDFQALTSTDNSTFTPLSNYTVQLNGGPAGAWNSTTGNNSYSYLFPLPASLNNLANVWVKLLDVSTTSIGGGTVAAGGTSRVDNVSIQTGPEPSSIVLLCMAGAAVFGVYRRTKR